MRLFILIFIVFYSFSVKAVWLDVSGKVETLTTYATNNTVIVRISQDGLPVEECSNTTHFAISRDISAEARARMYSALLAAKTAGTNIVISYNDVGNCESWGSNPGAYRRITRLR